MMPDSPVVAADFKAVKRQAGRNETHSDADGGAITVLLNLPAPLKK